MNPRRAGSGQPGRIDRPTTYDVRIWNVRKVAGKRGTTYEVRWSVAGKARSRSFKTAALADSFRSGLVSATRRGEPFDVADGIPVSMLDLGKDEQSWYGHARAFTEMKWRGLAPNSRRSVADTLATVTPAFLATRRGAPDPRILRDALYGWAFNITRSTDGDDAPSDDVAAALCWIERSTVPISALADPTYARAALDALAVKLDGSPAAANTIARKRAVLFSLIEYAIELGHLDVNPLTRIQWTAPKVGETVDRRVVVNPAQARALLDAVGGISRPLVGFFACMYYAGMRPAEVNTLREADLDLPANGGWGTLTLANSTPTVGGQWTDSGERETRQLKHRAKDETRPVPCAPHLVRILRDHLAEFGTAPDGRLFRGAQGGPVPDSRYGDVWRAARAKALTPAQLASPLARRPYDLRHAAVSTWLNAGVPATQVAEWAGHSVAVLLHVYAKCLAGQDQASRDRIDTVLNPGDTS
ncbi:tyrosine-type recombinase/integrase [Frankia sp. Cj5]|uniref:tyrosine-type recombinase/integrase n=1 Tax=Frankia sp. Cj5 TaxID=2880978 RepID=UPI001EF49EF4|nr:tyrosine-type recombinase/integrase [Frankia sp. Cj5]